MVYFKLILNDKRTKSNNIYQIVIRVTYNRNNRTLNTGVTVLKEYWDPILSKIKSSHSNSLLLNQSITDKYLKIQKAVLQLENEESFSFDALREKLTTNSNTTRVTKISHFNDFSQQLIDSMFATNKTGNAIVYQTSMNRLMSFAGKPKLKFTEINYTFLEGFKNMLITDGVKQNTISNYFRTIRAIYNKAIKAM